jgi:hypothetical protein
VFATHVVGIPLVLTVVGELHVLPPFADETKPTLSEVLRAVGKK